MIDRILNNRLKQQFQHIQLTKLRLRLYGVGQLTAVAGMLDFQITDDMLQLIGERDDVAALAEPQAEQLG
ncbi:hypothetical protein D3C71_1853660 [compost metagenome]